MENVKEVIPRKLHYCWFGGKEKPEKVKECIKSWLLLKDYEIIEWNESNCSFDENDFIKKAYREGAWCYIADYYRLKVIYEYGGIYLDTDTKVFRSFDPLLHHDVFINFIYNCSVGGGVIGAKPKSPFIGALLKLYDITSFNSEKTDKVLEIKDGRIWSNDFVTCNYYYTYYILKTYPEFKLNNKFQDMGDFVIYPKEYFEIGNLFKKYYTIHYSIGAWREKEQEASSKLVVKKIIEHFPSLFDIVQIVVRKRRYYILNKKIPFYAYSQAQRNNTSLPPL